MRARRRGQLRRREVRLAKVRAMKRTCALCGAPPGEKCVNRSFVRTWYADVPDGYQLKGCHNSRMVHGPLEIP